MVNAPKIDPIRDKYYKPLQVADHFSDALFYVGAVLSLVAFFVEKSIHPVLYDLVQIALIFAVAGIWALNMAIRVYFAPRAQNKRFQDFVSKAFGVPLSGHEGTEGYYNTDAIGPERLGAQLLENSFHSKDTALRMAWIERCKSISFLILLSAAALFRSTDLMFLALVAQAVFSEQLLSRWIRIEWLRQRFETIYAELYRLLQSKPNSQRIKVVVWELIGQYESAKATAGITLSESIFEKRNQKVSEEWQRIKSLLEL